MSSINSKLSFSPSLLTVASYVALGWLWYLVLRVLFLALLMSSAVARADETANAAAATPASEGSDCGSGIEGLYTCSPEDLPGIPSVGTPPPRCPEVPKLEITGGQTDVSGHIGDLVSAYVTYKVTCPEGTTCSDVKVVYQQPAPGSSLGAQPSATPTKSPTPWGHSRWGWWSAGNGDRNNSGRTPRAELCTHDQSQKKVTCSKRLYATMSNEQCVLYKTIWQCVLWPPCKCVKCDYHYWYRECSGVQSHASTGMFWLAVENECGVQALPVPLKYTAAGDFHNHREDVLTSPLALVLTPKLDYRSMPVSLVTFRLSESQKANQRVPWYGSPDVGILVWLPGSESEVRDGRDLFGTWTFGKKWHNGYEALSSLDEDRDGAVRGDELEGIKLWVDYNRDGHIDRGEIVELSAYGVEEISTQHHDTAENVLYGLNAYVNDDGYKARTEGRLRSGMSFDWFYEPLGAAAFRENIERLERMGYRVYEWAQDPLVYGQNKINGYLALKKTGEEYEGYAFGAAGAEGRYIIAQRPITTSLNGATLAIRYDTGAGERITLHISVSKAGELEGKEVSFDKSALRRPPFNGPPANVPQGGTVFDVWTSPLKISKAQTLPLLIEEAESVIH